jgi:hypothetical protein
MMKSRMAGWLGVVAAVVGVLTGCEGVISGQEIARVSLQAAAEGPPGAYAPVKFTFDPAMNPVAVNFRADFTMNSAEYGKWNSYRATLTQGGAVVATRTFNVNHPQGGGADSSPSAPTSAVHTLFYVDVQVAGEHELTITPAVPVAVTLVNAQADARRNVQRPPK